MRRDVGVAGLWYLVLAPVGVYLAIAFGLILSQPAPEPPVGDGLTAIQFKFPKAVLQGPLGHTATRAYSFRLNTSLAPRRNFRADIAKLPPYLVIVGSKDEAFRAEAYEPLFTAANPKGKFVLMQDVGHLDIVQNHDALAKIGQFLNAQA